MSANFWSKSWLPRHQRHPWDALEYILCLFRYPRWAARLLFWYDPPLRPGERGNWLTIDQWAKYVDVYFGLERPVAEQHLSSRRIVQRKLAGWLYLTGLSLIVFIAWAVIHWEQQTTAHIRHLWPIEIIIVQYLLPPIAFFIDWARYRNHYWQFDLRETHGTARWKRFDELRNKNYIVPRGQVPHGFAYLAPYNAIYDVVLPWEEMFRSRLFVGKPGSGKSSTFHANHLRFYAKDFNTVAVDIKGELYNQAAHYYPNVYRLDFRDPRYSDRFNLIRDCRGDITFTNRIAFTLIIATNKEGANSQNKYFYDAAKAVLTALILHLAEDEEHYPEATLNDLFYMLAGEYRTVTKYDETYFISRITDYLLHDHIEPERRGNESSPPRSSWNIVRARIRRVVARTDIPVLIRALMLTSILHFADEDARLRGQSHHALDFENTIYGILLDKAKEAWEKAGCPEDYDWEKTILSLIPVLNDPILQKKCRIQGRQSFNPEKEFHHIYRALTTLSPHRPDFRDFRPKNNPEYNEEGYFMGSESGRVARFLTEVFRNSPSAAARQSWATFQSSAGNDPRLLGNITSTLLTAIDCFRDPTVSLCFRNPTPEEAARGCRIIDWNFLRGEPSTALFLVMSAAQSIQLAPVVATIFSVIMEKLLRELNDPTGKKKIRPCYLQVDEGGNFKIPGIAEFVATCRGSAVCVDYSVQSVLQLNHLYGNEYGEMIKEVFGTKIFLPGSEGKTAELVSQLSGESTTRQRKIVDGPGNWQDREEDQEVKRNLVATYEARTLARHLEALCLLTDEPAIRITFPPFARDLDDRITHPPRYTDNILPPIEPPPDKNRFRPEAIKEDVRELIRSIFTRDEPASKTQPITREASDSEPDRQNTAQNRVGHGNAPPSTPAVADEVEPVAVAGSVVPASPSMSASGTQAGSHPSRTETRTFTPNLMRSVLDVSPLDNEPDSLPGATPPAPEPAPPRQNRPGMRLAATTVLLPSTEKVGAATEIANDDEP